MMQYTSYRNMFKTFNPSTMFKHQISMHTGPVFNHYCGCRWPGICRDSAGYNVRYVSIPISLAITNVDQYLIPKYHCFWYISQNNVVQIQVQTGALSTMRSSWLCLIHCMQFLLCKMLCTWLLLALDNKNGHINPCLIPFTKSCMQYCTNIEFPLSALKIT